MQIEIRSKNIDMTPSLRDYVRRRLSFALGARAGQIQRVQVMLSDINGPKGGNDKHCRILVNVPYIKDVVIEDCQTELKGAIDRAAARTSRTLTKRLMKLQKIRQVGHHDFPQTAI
ncbi:HPF/RaiA family ribosome-associated protein [Reinekea blandensis]|uniref:Ribosomal subunit interface protein n=1 Tax=Reinekea blandensis MED297 TaxID=314283 RepID=A4BJM4_9GAMM|nr:HPF/RaiA family ribosome-associated protein [Reinekea blandensis]EAR07664.1 hypothetical protein MED297_06479 [Reinekea sp. MED297] [Reinekea blandensis MED297]